MDGIYAVVDWMADVPHFTHQLPRAGDVCKPHLLRQHPWLAEITIPESVNNEAALRTFLEMVSARYGEYHEVQRIPEGEYVAQDPLAETAQMMTGCDSCRAVRHGAPDGSGPDGYAGTVTYTAGGTTRDMVAWFACRRTHIGPAVRAALDAAGELS